MFVSCLGIKNLVGKFPS